MNTVPLKLTKNLQSTLTPRKHAIRWISNYSPAKISNNNSYNLYECFDNHPIKITSGFWIVTSLNSVSAQLSDHSLGSLRLYKSIWLIINKSEASYFISYGYTWKFISPEDRPKGVASNLSVYWVSDYHISSIKCFCDKGYYITQFNLWKRRSFFYWIKAWVFTCFRRNSNS